MRTAISLRLLTAGIALLIAATAAAQSEPFSWNTSFETAPESPSVTADWDTVAGTLSLPSMSMTTVGTFVLSGGTERDIAVDGRVVHVLDGRDLHCLDGWQPELLPRLGQLYIGGGSNRLAAGGGLVVVVMAAAGLRVVDALDPENPVLVGTLSLPAATDVEISGRTAYVVGSDGRLRVVDLSVPSAPVLGVALALPGVPTTLAIDGDRLLAGLGAGGFVVVDVRAAAAPQILAHVATPAAVLGVDLLGDRAFVTTAGGDVRLYDLADPAQPTLAVALPTAATCTVVRTDGEFLYAGSSRSLERWRRPFGAQPEPAGAWSAPTTVRGLALSGRHAFVAAANVHAVELVAPNRLQFLAQMPGIQNTIICMDQDGDLLTMGHISGIYLADVSDPDAPVMVGEWSTGTEVRDLDLAGDHLVYVTYPTGLSVLDVADPSSPVLVDAAPGASTGLAVDGGLAVTHGDPFSNDNPVVLWDISDPANGITALGSINIPGGINIGVLNYALHGTRLYVGTTGSIEVVDVSDPLSPAIIATVPLSGWVQGLALAGDRLLAIVNQSDVTRGLHIYDVSVTGTPQLIDVHETNDWVYGLEVVGDRAYVIVGNSFNMHVVDLSDPSGSMMHVQSDATGSGWVPLTTFGCTRGWMRTDHTVVRNVRFASDAWQPLQAYAEIPTQPLAGVIGARAQIVHDGDIAAFKLTSVINGFWGDFVPGIPDIPAPWQYVETVPDGAWSWNASIALDAAGNPPVIHDLEFEFLFERPVITSVTDVPNDQGRQLRLQWRRSGYDRAGSPQPLLGYALYRLVDPLLGEKALNPPSAEEAKSLPLGDWDYLSLVPADGEDKYSVIVPSLGDHAVETGDYVTTYLVRARTTTVGLNHDSLVLGGVSVDNLAPNAPQQFMVAYTGDGNSLTWLESTEADLRHYNVYRGDHAGFVPEPANLVRQLTAATWLDEAPAPFAAHYQVTAVDFAGNESAAAPADFVVDAPATPAAAFGLAQNVPNPFNPRTLIGFSLERAGAVRLRIHDVAGRLVRTLHDGDVLAAGRHQTTWEGLDDAGRPAAAGVYHCRLEAGGSTASRRLTLLK